MTDIIKVISTEVVAKTNISSPKLVVNKGILHGIKRHILVSSNDINTVIREYIQKNDLMQNATELLGVVGFSGMIDWNDETYSSYSETVSPSSSVQKDIWKFDLGDIYEFYIYYNIGAKANTSNLGTNNTCSIKIYVSNDDITYILVDSLTATDGEATKTGGKLISGRYIKITYEAVNNDSVANPMIIKVYSLELYANEDNYCIKYTYVDNNTLFADHEVQTMNQKVSVIIFTNNAIYRIIDIDLLSRNYINIDYI